MVAPPAVFKAIDREGFTLVELSIVMVIIGLIIGGVLVGRDLINAAAVRAQISQIEKYKTAVNTFRGKYGYLPGDIPDPAASSYGFAARGTGAAQGDGNGIIDGGCVALTHRYGCETALFWKDLGQAGLMDGDFSAVSYTGGPITIPVTTGMANYIPSAKIGNGNYIAVYPGNGGGVWGDNGINYLFLGVITSTSAGPGDYVTSGGISPSQAYAIDIKTDDGLPQSGRIKTATGLAIQVDTTYSATNCATSATQYNITYSVFVCGLSFQLQ